MTDEQLNKRFDDLVEHIGQVEERVNRRTDERMEHVKNDLVELIRQVETNLLTGFHSYARGINARLTTHDATYVTLNERMTALEERMLNLETRGRH